MLMPTTAYCPSCLTRMTVHVDDEAQKIHPRLVLGAMVDKMAADHDPACARYHEQQRAERAGVTA